MAWTIFPLEKEMTMPPTQRIRVTPPAAPTGHAGSAGEPSKMPVGVRRNISVQGFVKEGKPFPT
jgi:hypothetical protein